MEKRFLLGPCFGVLILEAFVFVLVLECLWIFLGKRGWGERRKGVTSDPFGG